VEMENSTQQLNCASNQEIAFNSFANRGEFKLLNCSIIILIIRQHHQHPFSHQAASIKHQANCCVP